MAVTKQLWGVLVVFSSFLGGFILIWFFFFFRVIASLGFKTLFCIFVFKNVNCNIVLRRCILGKNELSSELLNSCRMLQLSSMLSNQLFCKASGNSDSLKQTYFSAAHLINLHLDNEKAFPVLFCWSVCFYLIGWLFFFLSHQNLQLPKYYSRAIHSRL